MLLGSSFAAPIDVEAAMSNSWAQAGGPIPVSGAGSEAGAGALTNPLPMAAQYSLSLVFVALAAALAFVVEHLVAAPNLTLIFVLPVVVAATAFGWGPALLAVTAGVLAFDFFFTQPYYSLRIASPGDLWAAALLLVIAAIVSGLAAQSRRRAIAAEQSAEQARALQDLAHLIIESHPEWEILRAAANALHRAFRVPAVVGLRSAGSIKAVASAGGATLAGADEEAALGALQANIATRAGMYPYDRSRFDFWPVASEGDQGWVIGLAFRDRPEAPERFIDVVRGYIAATVSSAASQARAHG
jgi:K+-sensing histidine kinase KdpD